MPKKSSGAKACSEQRDDSLLQPTIGRSEVGTGLFERKHLLFDEEFPHGEKIRTIDREHMNGGAANRGPATEHRSIPLKVFAPQVPPWMEEANVFPRVWIYSRDVRTLVPIAVKTGEGEILKNSLATMLACDDVINMKGQRIYRCGKVAILAPALGALPAFPDNLSVHERRRSDDFVLRAMRALDCMTASRFPTCR